MRHDLLEVVDVSADRLSRRRKEGAMNKIGLRAAAIALSALICAVNPGAALAAGILSISDITAPNVVGDSNVASTGEGPDAFTLGAQVCNTGTDPLEDVFVEVGDGVTPGEFPDTVVTSGAYTGTFELELTDTDTSDAVRYLGDIAPGDCVTVYWQVEYPVVDGANNPTFGLGSTTADDLQLDFVLSGSAIDSSTNATVSSSVTDMVVVRSEITASANKIFPSGASTSISPGTNIDVGEIITVTFSNVDFGTVNQGFDLDGIPGADYDLWFQPIGESTLFDSDSLRLIAVDAEVRGTGCGGGNPDVTLTLEDEWYLKQLDQYGNCGWSGDYTYTFIALSPGSSTLTPYQEVASGNNNEKYNGDYCGDDPAGEPTICYPMEVVGSNITIAKVVDKPVAHDGDTLTYTMTYANSGDVAVGDPGSGNPVEIRDSIPADTTYVGGSASCVAPCTILYSTDNGATYSSTEPSPASSVTDLRYLLDDPVAAMSSNTVGFQVVIDTGFVGIIPNVATISIDSGPPVDEDDDETEVNLDADVGITKIDLSDPVSQSGSLTYRVTVTNNGPADATNVVVTDQLDADTTYMSDTAGCAHAAGVLTCSLGGLVNGGSTSFDVTVSVSATAPTAGSLRDGPCDGSEDLCNNVSVTIAETDLVPSNNDSDEPTDVVECLTDGDCDDGVGCTTDVCVTASGSCQNTPSDVACDDNLYCNGAEFCDPTNDCQAGTAVDCGDSVACTDDSCDEATDSCVNTENDSNCDDLVFCNGVETCDAILDCQPGTAVDCSDGVTCTDDSCDEVADTCVSVANDVNCSDGLFCTGIEICDPVADCVAGTPPDCNDGVVCTDDSCNDVTDSCDNLANDANCDDGFFCTGAETCDDLADCQVGIPIDCSGLNGQCLIGECDDTADSCVANPFNEGGACDDGDVCTVGDLCLDGVCEPGGSTCGDGDVDGICGEQCDPPNGITCDDNCQVIAVCGDGVVEGGEQCDPPSAEICNDLTDNDGDTLSDCLDPDCAGDLPTCGPDCLEVPRAKDILKDPAVVRFRDDPKRDFWKIHGKVAIDPGAVDPVEDGFGISLANECGTIFSAELFPGDLIERRAGSYFFIDREAKDGVPLRSGLYRVRVRIRETRGQLFYHFNVKAYGDFSAADKPFMATQLTGVDSTACLAREWDQKAKGWILKNSAF